MKRTTRAEVPIEETWDLTDIFESDQKWEEAVDKIENSLDNWEELLLPLNNAEQLVKSLNNFDDLLGQLDRVHSYARFKHTEDSTDANHQRMMGRSSEIKVKSNRMKTHYRHELLQITKEEMEDYLAENEELREFSSFLNNLEKVRAYTLPLEIENTFASLNHVLESPQANYR